jgi:hypothetical protein
MATTSTGLKTTVNVIHRAYETGRNATEAMKQDLNILVTVHSRSVLQIDERLVGFAVEFCGDRLVQTVKEATPLFSAGGDG